MKKIINNIIKINNKLLGNKYFTIIPGPCSIENFKQLFSVIEFLKKEKINLIRAGTFKLRTNSKSFQGLGYKSIEIIKEIKKNFNINIVSEITKIKDIEIFYNLVDIMQVGTRNMYNYPLLKELGKTKKTIILKRAFCSTVKEFILSSEYIIKEGNKNLILCERGIRTFENSTRNTLDLSSVSLIKKELNFPIIIDPSHALGRTDILTKMCLAGVVSGADGILIEINEYPKKSLSDSRQTINFEKFKKILKFIKKMLEEIGKKYN